MAATAEHDVLVLGGGPSGSAAAIRLADFGFDVALVERKTFPREHVGICLSDTTVLLLQHLNVGTEFEDARFWRRGVTAVYWGDDEVRLAPQAGYHVDRGVLDTLLLERARRAGVAIHQPASVVSHERLAAGGWRFELDTGQGVESIGARIVVDAAGRQGALRGQRVKDGPPLLALHAMWALADAPRFDGLIEAGESAWLWYAQTARDQAVVSVFCDPRRLASHTAPLERYLNLLRQFPALRQQHLARRLSPLKACDATSQHAADPVGEQCVRVGDAGLAVDPLSSQGVHLAIQSGLQGAVVVNTILAKPSNAEAARQFHSLRSADRVGLYASRTRSEYARVAAARPKPHAFWTERAAGATAAALASASVNPPSKPAVRVALAADVTIDTAPVIDGDYVELREVVRQQGVEGCFAYVDGVQVARMLSAMPAAISFSSLPALWRDWVSPTKAIEIAHWLWARRVLVSAAEPI